MRMRRPGRPRKIDVNRKQISIDQAVSLTKEFWKKFGKTGYSKGYIYNLISRGELARDSRGKGVLLFEDEVRAKLCG